MLHKQIKRVGNVAMFEVRGAGVEIALIRIAKPAEMPGGAMVPWREIYPSTEEFGSKGWYFPDSDRDEAERRFTLLSATTK
jgi:hypothetical protein